ncbi:hypothetical protein Tel_07210 [Candidatus Tenderia electrophaga]|uniref:MltA-interacting MipA family protein n=1 Tax=Candidatus Tenderia electrophaga TaxID=1748243 RepID=A0A0S2TCU7_9GAMM|nr:hypothetical protein Tel_07210 [Candidatus Tenderia electrophaga]
MAWHVQAGALVLAWPEYEGADKYEVKAFPLIGAEYKRRFFINFINGAGMYLLNSGALQLGTGVAYAFGRDEDDSAHLRGLGHIDGGALFNLFGEYTSGPYSLGAKYLNQVSGDDTGYMVEVGAGYHSRVRGDLILKYGMQATYADSDYMASFFGVSQAQSLASGLVGYSAAAGFKSAALQLRSIYLLSPKWAMQGHIKLERLLGDAADSPVVQDERQVSLVLGLVYHF